MTINAITNQNSMNFYKFKDIDFNGKIENNQVIKIAIIDDSKKDMDLTLDILRTDCRMHIDLLPFVRINEALEYVQQERNQIDLVLLDINMPSMNGKMVLDRIKNITHSNDLPVVICSSMNNYQTLQEVKDLQAHAFFAKPLDGEAFAGYLLGR